jgi:DNA-binding MarR family transcriptional regulator
MRMYSILSDRTSVNILKAMHDNEFVQKKSHTMTYSELRDKLLLKQCVASLRNLSAAGFIAKQAVEEELVLSMTDKGKRFVEEFDKLVMIFNGVKQEQQAYNIHYELTDLENKILLNCFKLHSETGTEIALEDVAREAYPHKEPAKSKSTLSKYMKRLEQLHLVTRIPKPNRVFFDLTQSGERVARELLAKEQEKIKVEIGGAV